MKVIPCIGSNLPFENQEPSTRTCSGKLGLWSFIERNATIGGFSVTTKPYGTIIIDWGDNKPKDTINSGSTISHSYSSIGGMLPVIIPGGGLTTGGGVGGTIGTGTLSGGSLS